MVPFADSAEENVQISSPRGKMPPGQPGEESNLGKNRLLSGKSEIDLNDVDTSGHMNYEDNNGSPTGDRKRYDSGKFPQPAADQPNSSSIML